MDHQFNDNSKLFVEYLLNPSWYTNYRLPWLGPTAQTAGVAGAQPYRTMNQIFTVGHTQTFGGSLINEARASFSRQNQRATPNPDSLVNNKAIQQKVAGLNFIEDPIFFPVPSIYIGGLPGFGPQQWQNAIQGEDAFTVLDNVTKIIGSHTLKTGLMWRRDRNWNLAGWGYNLGFGGGLTNDPVTGLGGNGLTQFLLGAVDQGSGTGTYAYAATSANFFAKAGAPLTPIVPFSKTRSSGDASSISAANLAIFTFTLLPAMCSAVPPTACERLPNVPIPCFTTAVSP